MQMSAEIVFIKINNLKIESLFITEVEPATKFANIWIWVSGLFFAP